MLNHSTLALRILAVTLLLGTVSSATLSAQNWRGDINQSAALLHKSDYDGSLKIADRVVSEMVQKLGTQDDLFATALTHKALASAGLGNVNDALWYWYIAQAISPAGAKTDLSEFGAAGEFLKRHPFSNAEMPVRGSVTPARVVKQVLPKFPAGASKFGIAGDLVVQIIIDRNGQPTLPRIVRALPAPTLSFVALEALRHWQFEPGRSNGQPISMPFDLTVHYKL
jgi:TonB family protein